MLDKALPVHIDIVCRTAGLTTGTYSFGYVAQWSGGDQNAVKATAERVIVAARTILVAAGLVESVAVRPPELVAA